jgi:hypothetical protein
MATSSADSAVLQGSFSAFLVRVVRSTAAAGAECTEEAIVAAVTRELGGGTQAEAVLTACSALLAFSEAVLPEGSTVLDEEDLATVTANRVVRPVEEVRLQQRIEAVEGSLLRAVICPQAGCGARAHARGKTAVTLVGRHGPLKLWFRWFICQNDQCGHSFAVARPLFGRGTHRFTPGCAEAVTLMATTVAYGKAASTLSRLLKLEVSEHALQDLVEERGETLAALDLVAAQKHEPRDKSGLARRHGRPADAVPSEQRPAVAYLETDGVFAIDRELKLDESAKYPGARGGKGRKYDLEGREIKNGVLYRAQDHAQEMPSRGCLLHKRFVSRQGAWRQFAGLLWTAMLQLRFDQARLLVILSDGAEWIRSLAAWLPMEGRVLLILDFYHAAHRVWEVARLLYGEGTDLCQQRARMWCEVIEQGHVEYIIRELAALRGYPDSVQTAIAELVTYFENNKDRMDYPQYQGQGLRITSGIVESANFHVIGARLMQQGMRWTEKASGELAVLRADLCNDRWEQRSRQLLAA